MIWTFFEAALDRADDASAALDALTASYLPELTEILAAVGAEEAAPLLGEARTAAEPAERHAKLEAVLDIIDPALDVYTPLTTVPVQGLGAIDDVGGPGADFGDVARVAVLAALIDAELGSDAGMRRRRALMAVTAMNVRFATQKGLQSKKDRSDEFRASNRVFAKVLGLLTNDLQKRRPRFRIGRRA